MKKASFIFLFFAMQSLSAMEETTIEPKPVSPEQLFNELLGELISYETTNSYSQTRDAVKILIELGADINKRFPASKSRASQDLITLTQWALKGERDLSIYEILLENGASISPQLNFSKSRRVVYISVKHIIHRICIPHKTRIRELMLCLTRIGNENKVFGEWVKKSKDILKPHLIKPIKAECKEALGPYEQMRKEYKAQHGKDICDDASIQRFLDLFFS